MFSAAFNISSMTTNTSLRPSPHLHYFKQPPNLKQTIICSKLPSFQENSIHDITQPCHGNLCKTCQIIDTDTTITREDTTHQVHGSYSCDSANVVYLIRCRKGCPGAWYIGETMQILRQRMNGHRATIARQEGSLPVREHFSSQGHSATDLRVYNNFPKIMDFLPGTYKKLFQNGANMRTFVKEMIQSHKESFQKDFPTDYIDSFLIKMDEEKHKPNSEFIDGNLLLTVTNLIMAGTESIGVTLLRAIQVLVKFPQIQEKINQEIDEVIGSCRRPTIEDRAKMPYTDAVIHEIQRYVDISPIGLPHMVTTDIEFRGYLIPEGTCVVPVFSSVLKSPSQWETPESFNPNHFLDENGHFKKNESFMPFSAGKRICPGESLARMELFLFLTTLFQNFLFNPVINHKKIDISPIRSAITSMSRDYEFCAISR
ncbi:cytochrome P450 2C31-like isoform X3 [Heptranchias perlo]|uniref:cytochrome P450 2C31-like isoform X3 n=1 Tax=Heptranchias perlo TaxID=212740 RepID=UPI003559CB29